MFENFNFTIIAIIAGCAVIGLIMLVFGGSKTKQNHENEVEEYNQERASRDAAGAGDGSYYSKL